MSNLSKLIQMQKAQSNANPAATSKAPSESQPEEAKDSQPRMGLNLLRKSSTPASPPRKPVAEAAPEKPNVVESDSFSLDDLASFDAGSIEPIRESATRQGFIDEIEATAPDRELPTDLSAQQLGFVEQLDGIYQVLNDADMFAQSVRVLMIELQENPEYIKLVSDQDVHTMIRGMRNSMGLARIRKQEKSRKAGTKTKTAAQKKSRVSDDVMDLLNSLGGDDD